MEFIDLLMHTDEYLTKKVEANIMMTYVILFLVLFSESAFIIFPFLPGDGLLFSAGVVAASTDLNFYIIVTILIIAAITGFIVNYHIGAWAGQKLLKREIPFIQKYYTKTSTFLSRYGLQAVLISRFFPVLRTYLPFVAGIVNMQYRIFMRYTILGAFIWVLLFTTTGFLVGEIPWVKNNYGFIFLGLVVITLVPMIYALFRSRFISRRQF